MTPIHARPSTRVRRHDARQVRHVRQRLHDVRGLRAAGLLPVHVRELLSTAPARGRILEEAAVVEGATARDAAAMRAGGASAPTARPLRFLLWFRMFLFFARVRGP